MKKHLCILTLVLVCSQALSATSMSARLAGGVAQQPQKTDKFEAAGVLVAETVSKDLLPLTQDMLVKHKAVFASLLTISLASLSLHKVSPQQLNDCIEILSDIAALAQENFFSDKTQEALLKELAVDIKKACSLAAGERNQQNIAPRFMQEVVGSLSVRWNFVVEKIKIDNPAAYEKVCAYQKEWEPMIADIMQTIVRIMQQERAQLTRQITQEEQDQASEQIAFLMDELGADERFAAIDSALGAVLPLLRTPADGMQLGKAVCIALEKNPAKLIQATNACKATAIPVMCQIVIDALAQFKKEQSA